MEPLLRFARLKVICGTAVLAGAAMLRGQDATTQAIASPPSEMMARHTLYGDDVVFMYMPQDTTLYQAYGATFQGWGGASTGQDVRRLESAGVFPTVLVWSLTPGAQLIHVNPDVARSVVVDIEGKPVAVPWLFDQTYQGTPTYFGCTNQPAFRAVLRERMAVQMRGGAMGLHIDDHLGTAGSLWYGGCFCDACMQQFQQWLKAHGTPEMLREAGRQSWEGFDYRELVRTRAPTREQYVKIAGTLPLHDAYVDFQLQQAEENVRELGALGAEIVHHPILLSANTGLPELLHTAVTPQLTHLICEVDQHSDLGTGNLLEAVQAYRMAEAINRPMAATAHGADWAYVKAHHATTLAKLWIALAYSAGQRMMVPSHQWCYTPEKGTDWYDGPTEIFAPVFRFVRANSQLFRDTRTRGPLTVPANVPHTFDTKSDREALAAALAAGNPKPMHIDGAGAGAWIFPRQAADGSAVIHLLNLNYRAADDSMGTQTQLRVTLPTELSGKAPTATMFSYDGASQQLEVKRTGTETTVVIPELRLWAVLQIQ